MKDHILDKYLHHCPENSKIGQGINYSFKSTYWLIRIILRTGNVFYYFRFCPWREAFPIVFTIEEFDD